MKKRTRILSLALAVILWAGLLPLSALGAEGTAASAGAAVAVEGGTSVGRLIANTLDGTVDRKDRIYLARYLAGWAGYELTDAAALAADVNGDGTVDRKDRIYLARYLAGWAGYTL